MRSRAVGLSVLLAVACGGNTGKPHDEADRGEGGVADEVAQIGTGGTSGDAQNGTADTGRAGGSPGSEKPDAAHEDAGGSGAASGTGGVTTGVGGRPSGGSGGVTTGVGGRPSGGSEGVTTGIGGRPSGGSGGVTSGGRVGSGADASEGYAGEGTNAGNSATTEGSGAGEANAGSNPGAGGAETEGGAEGGGHGGETAEPNLSLLGAEFDIQMVLGEEEPWCEGPCVPATVLVTEVSATQLELVWGSTGRATPLSLTRSGADWAFSDTLLLGSERTWDYALCDNESQLGPATFHFSDTTVDSDSALTITGHQASQFCSDDYVVHDDSDVTLAGSPFSRAPKLVELAAGVEPVHGVHLEVDKPLVADAACSLVPGDGGAPVVMTPRLMNGYVVGFDTDVVLPLGAVFTTQVTGEDFAGAATPPSIELSILDDFGVLVPDGFESGSTAGIREAVIVDSLDVPAIGGARMLYVEPGAEALLRLRRTGDEAALVLDLRKTFECGGFPRPSVDEPLEISVAVVGGTPVAAERIAIEGEPLDATLSGSPAAVGEIETLSAPLEGSGEDVLVHVNGDDYRGAGCLRIGALIDNVRLE